MEYFISERMGGKSFNELTHHHGVSQYVGTPNSLAFGITQTFGKKVLVVLLPTTSFSVGPSLDGDKRQCSWLANPYYLRRWLRHLQLSGGPPRFGGEPDITITEENMVQLTTSRFRRERSIVVPH